MIIDETIEIHAAKKSALQDLFKTMLNKLMTGKIRVKELDIDISEVST
jgi:type I restriction enzyme S subunit